MKKIIFILLSLLFVTTPLFAQNAEKKNSKPQTFEVKKFEFDQTDISATEMSKTFKKDKDKKLMAIIKVTATNYNDTIGLYKFNFGSQICETVKVDDELWVYVQYGAKRVSIMRNGFKTLKDYSLGQTLQQGKVYRMEISALFAGENVKKELKRDPYLEFKITPLDAIETARIKYKKNTDDAKWEYWETEFDEDGRTSEKFPRGIYFYEVEAEGYRKSEGTIELVDKNLGEDNTYTAEVFLHSKEINVEVFADENAEIYVDNTKVGIGEWFGKLEDGEHTVEARRANHRSISRTVKIDNRRALPVRFPVLQPIFGGLSIVGEPIGATVKIDGEPYDTISFRTDSLIIGKHFVEVFKPGYQPESFFVDINEGEMCKKEVALHSIAQVTIVTEPADAIVYINDAEVGYTPYSTTLLSGDYKLQLVKKGFHKYKKVVNFNPENQDLNYKFKPQYQKKSTAYLELAVQAGSFDAARASFGFYAHNFNVELFGNYGLFSEPISSYTKPEKCDLGAMGFGGRLGFGVVLGRFFRITPQVGAGYLILNGNGINTSAITASGALRCEFAYSKSLGFSFTPEYTHLLEHEETFGELSSLFPKVAGWGKGMSYRLGVYLFF